MIKRCVICGAEFKSPPSDKTVTCSSACRSERARRARVGRKVSWSEDAKRRRAADPDIQAAMSNLQPKATAAAMAIPEGQRGPQNRESKVWVLIYPSGEQHRIVNLLDWARRNYQLFEPPTDDVDAAAMRVASGFKAIASSIRGRRGKSRPATTYKGWSLAGLPEKK